MCNNTQQRPAGPLDWLLGDSTQQRNTKLEDEIMGKTYYAHNDKAPVPEEIELTYKTGDIVMIRGAEYRVGQTGLKYLLSNGNPDTLYAVLHSKRYGDHSKRYGDHIMTHRRIMEEAPMPIVTKYVTPAQIINAGACDDGLRGLGLALGIFKDKEQCQSLNTNQLVYRLTVECQAAGTLQAMTTVESLWKAHNKAINGATDTSWLLFVARLLNLVPATGRGPDHSTLKRLLGIK